MFNKKLLHPNEKIMLDVKPISRVIPYWVIANGFQVLVFALILLGWLIAGIFHNIYFAIFRPHLSQIILGMAAVFVVLLGILYLWFKSRRKAHEYCITNQRCIFSYGTWTNNKAIVPFNRVADVYTYQSVLEKMFGLTSLYVTDMGMANALGYGSVGRRSTVGNRGLLRMQGLSEDNAEKILEIISEHISSVQTVRVEK